MKITAFKIVIFITIAILSTGCSTFEDEPKQNEVVLNEEDSKENSEETIGATIEKTTENEAVNDFALKSGDKYINLKDWDFEVNLDEVFGTPISEVVEELGIGAATHTGSFIKKIEYDGLHIELFSPMQNGKDFWIMTMEITKKGYRTSKGIEIGNTVDEIKDTYPSLKIVLDGRTDPNNCAYGISNDEHEYNYLQLEVKEGLVSRIKIYHLLA